MADTMTNATTVRDPAVAERDCRSRLGIALLFTVAIGANVWFTLGDHLTRLDANHTDPFAQLPWMYRWIDPDLFPDDPVNDYFQTFHAPPGMRAIYYLLVARLGIDLIVAGRLVTVFWYALTLWLYLAVIRRAVPGRSWVLTLAAVTIALIPYNLTFLFGNSLFSPMIGGVARSAAGAVLLLAVYGLAAPSRFATNIAMAAGAAFYPPAFVIAFAMVALSVATAGPVRNVVSAGLAVLPGMAAAAIVIFAWYPLGVDPRFGPSISMDDISWAPQIEVWQFPYGRSFFQGVVVSWVATCWPAVVAVVVQAAVIRGGRLLRANLTLLAASAATTAAGYLLWPRFFEISRFETYPRTVVTNVAAAAVIAAGIQTFARRKPRWSPTRTAWIAVGAYVIFNAALAEYRVARARPTVADRDVADLFLRRVVAELAETPKDTVVAGIPGEIGDAVPLLARRTFVIHQVALFPYHRIFHREAIDRYLAVRDAVYATDWSAVRRLQTNYRVRFLIVNRARYDPTMFDRLAGGVFAQTVLPQLVQPVVEQGSDRPFVLRQPPPQAVAVEEGVYQLIDLDRIP
jgi:hypothetical protein